MVYLINPFITSAERYGKDIGDIGGHQMPLGIYYLAASLIKDSVEVNVIDAEALNLVHEEVVALLIKSDTKIVGITSTTVAFRNTRMLAEMIRKALPDINIVIGGPHMTAMPDATMKTGAFDYGIVREGEIAFSKLVQLLLYGRGTIDEIPNLYYKNAVEIVCNPGIEYIQDIDTIPFPARHLWSDISVYKPPIGAFRQYPVISMITSRGCPYQCIFCDNNTFGRKTRFFSAEYVVAEISEVINKYGAREIAFLDDTFVLDKKRLYKIFDLLAQKRIKFTWTCMTRVNNLDYKTLKFMKDNGCWQIRFGIESGNQEVLNFIKKGITLEQVRNVTEWCRRLKISSTGFFMIGHHIDTPQTIQETIDFAASLPLTDVTATINTPIPGTESYEKAKEYGTYDESDWTSLNYWTPVFVPRGLTRDFMLQKQAELYRRFYFRFEVIVRQILKIRSFNMFLMSIKNAILGLGFIGTHKKK
ncbi:MAG: radical SAM protein [Nitrospirae bacterium]|nr:radical SAM protein [Nitrospirota bacterium]